MTQFQASLIAAGDPEPLPTVVELVQGKLLIQSNGQTLGKWDVSDLEFVRIVGGFRVTLDGEVTVLKLSESDEFNAELRLLNEAAAEVEPPKKEKKRRHRHQSDDSSDSGAVAVAKHSAAKVAAPAPERSAEAAPAPERSAEAADPVGQSFVHRLDARLEVAAKRWGQYVPEWVFTRGGVVVAFLFLVAVFVFPGVFSTIFLIVAAIGMIASATALMDQVIATRIFRGKFTPIHGLIGSLALILIGLVLASL
ncbi:MAG TPA: hypothetical protein VMO52_08620 [Acidimicrobiia bacterium]|nr:hypothetical protein [Acidimicrobiia bacterium]